MIERLRALRRLLPRVHVALGPALPGWALRVTAALLPALLILAALVRTPMWSDEERQTQIIGVLGNPTMAPSRSATFVGIVLIVAAVLAVSALRWPSAWQPLVAVLATVVMMVLTPGGRWWALAFAVLGYLGYRLAVLSAAVPWGARVEWAVLARGGRTDLLVVGVTLVIGCMGLLLDGDLPLGLVLGSFGVLGLAWWVRRPRFGEEADQEVDAFLAAKRARRATLQIDAARLPGTGKGR